MKIANLKFQLPCCLLALVLVISLQPSAFASTAIVPITDAFGNPLAGEKCVVTFAGVPLGQSGGTAVQWRSTFYADANGVITLTNAATGCWTVSPVDANAVGFSFYMPVTNGTIQAQQWLVTGSNVYPPGNVAYTMAASDLRYLQAGQIPTEANAISATYAGLATNAQYAALAGTATNLDAGATNQVNLLALHAAQGVAATNSISGALTNGGQAYTADGQFLAIDLTQTNNSAAVFSGYFIGDFSGFYVGAFTGDLSQGTNIDGSKIQPGTISSNQISTITPAQISPALYSVPVSGTCSNLPKTGSISNLYVGGFLLKSNIFTDITTNIPYLSWTGYAGGSLLNPTIHYWWSDNPSVLDAAIWLTNYDGGGFEALQMWSSEGDVEIAGQRSIMRALLSGHTGIMLDKFGNLTLDLNNAPVFNGSGITNLSASSLPHSVVLNNQANAINGALTLGGDGAQSGGVPGYLFLGDADDRGVLVWVDPFGHQNIALDSSSGSYMLFNGNGGGLSNLQSASLVGTIRPTSLPIRTNLLTTLLVTNLSGAGTNVVNLSLYTNADGSIIAGYVDDDRSFIMTNDTRQLTLTNSGNMLAGNAGGLTNVQTTALVGTINGTILVGNITNLIGGNAAGLTNATAMSALGPNSLPGSNTVATMIATLAPPTPSGLLTNTPTAAAPLIVTNSGSIGGVGMTNKIVSGNSTGLVPPGTFQVYQVGTACIIDLQPYTNTHPLQLRLYSTNTVNLAWITNAFDGETFILDIWQGVGATNGVTFGLTNPPNTALWITNGFTGYLVMPTNSVSSHLKLGVTIDRGTNATVVGFVAVPM